MIVVYTGKEADRRSILDWIMVALILIILGLVIFLTFTGCSGGGGGVSGPGGGATGGGGSGTGTISGVITKTNAGAAEGASVATNEGPSSTTNVSGEYTIFSQTVQVKTVTAILAGYQTCKKNVQVTSGTVTCNIKMPPNASGIVPPPITTGIDDVNGPAGQTVTITGNGFGASEGVINFGGFQADVIAASWTATSIQAKVPISLSGQVDVEVIRSNDGQKSGNNIKFTISP